MYLWWAVYLLGGAVAGVMAGLLGVGGGLILVPVLLALLPFSGVRLELLMHTALGSSLAAIVLTSVASMRAHHARGAVQWPTVRILAPTLALGAAGAGSIAAQFESAALTVLFAAFALLLALRIWRTAQQVVAEKTPSKWTLPVAGGVIGVISGLVGIGGGSLTVPLLLRYGTPMTQAVATSAACGFPIAVFGTLGFIYAGWSSAMPPAASGFVYWPAVLSLTAASWFTAPVGAKLAHRWPPARLKRIFALFLIVVASKLIFELLNK